MAAARPAPAPAVPDEIVAATADSLLRPSWCDIDLGAVTHNIGQLRRLVGPGVQIHVCLKSDAMGCGAEAVARRAEAAGADGLAFGNIDSAIACRRAGVGLPMLLYPGCLPQAAPILESWNLTPTLSTRADVAAWSQRVLGRLPVFLKIDGGGFRAGALPGDAAEIARAIVASPALALAGVYGHPMASYGIAEPGYIEAQIGHFRDALARIEAAGIRPPIRMVSSSDILLSHPEADLNAVDPGRLVMGMRFPAVAERRCDWRPALTGLKSRLVMVRSLDRLGDVAPPAFFAHRPGMRLGLVPLGWHDGFPRRLPDGAGVLIRGRRAALLGPVHAELLRVDLTDLPDADVGDEVVFLGRSGTAEITIADLCRQWQTDEVGLYTAIPAHLPRIYH